MRTFFFWKIVFEAALEVVAVSESYYHLCDRAAGTGRNIRFLAFASRPEIVMEVQTASAPLPTVCSLQTQTSQAEMRPASVLICIYPTDDLLLSLLC